MKLTTAFLLLIFCLSACHSQEVLKTNQQNINRDLDNEFQTTSKKSDQYGEITNCTPEKFGCDTKLIISLKSPNGGYLAIEREGKNPDYYLLSTPENSEDQNFAAAANSLPFWTVETLKTLSRLELDSSQIRAVNLSKLNNEGEGKAEPIFNQTGWYKILLSDENFEQDEPVITGQCRVFYDNTVSPQKLSETKKLTKENNVISWNYKEKSLNFETQFAVENNQPTAFLISGSRTTVISGGEESANECSFGVDKDKNNSVWQTLGNKTFISGKNDSGTDFKMFIEKTDKGFLIDTSAAAESCFNVGVPGDILLTRNGSKYNGKFISPKSK